MSGLLIGVLSEDLTSPHMQWQHFSYYERGQRRESNCMLSFDFLTRFPARWRGDRNDLNCFVTPRTRNKDARD